MPNPFMKLGAQNESKTPPDRPQPIEPIPEDYEGSNHPYRGIEIHGVADVVDPVEMEPFDPNATLVPYEKPEDEQDPIPVKIVTQGGKEFKDWQVRREYALLNVPTRIIGQNDARTAMRVRNLSANAVDIVWVGPNSSVTDWTGFPIPSNSEFTISAAESDVWAIVGAAGATSVSLAIIEEFTIKQ